MPKSVIIIVFVVLIIGVAAGGVFVARQRLGGGDAAPAEKQEQEDQFGVLQPAGTDEQRRLLAADDDNDGLTNNEEISWGTDPNNADSDGDGYLDGEEVAARHDPTKPAPDDKLPEETQAEGGQLPLQLEPLKADKYFTDDYTKGNDKNLTAQYESEYARADQTPASLNEFADKQPVVALLPRPDSGMTTTAVEDTAARLEHYLSIADNDNALANTTLYVDAQYQLQTNNNPSAMLSLVSLVTAYREELAEAQVPESAMEVHRLLLGHTEALAITFEQIAQRGDDPAGSLVAARQLEVIDRTYYPIIKTEFGRLEAIQQKLAQ
ncbi:MAG: hypothetical protein ABIH36_01065 [bacterium]